MSPTFMPARARSFGTANAGPMPISSGSHPATAKPRKIPSGARPFEEAIFALITTHAEAPSENWLAFPAAITPPGIAGRIFDTPSYVVSARMPSSAETVTDFVKSPPVLSATPAVTVMGTISSANFPAAAAAAARCWLLAPYSSCLSRAMP